MKIRKITLLAALISIVLVIVSILYIVPQDPIIGQNQIAPQTKNQITLPEKQIGLDLPDTPGPEIGNKTLADLCKSHGIDISSLKKGLEFKGMTITPDKSLKKLALENNISVQTLYDMIRKSDHGQKMCRVKFSKGKF